jgi:hypothetical protein
MKNLAHARFLLAERRWLEKTRQPDRLMIAPRCAEVFGEALQKACEFLG